ncbi:twin transmembrane helix small protein [Derxia gummosa]|uniref:Twin transmembrane helix small protein n=1 Tax=Derxia gummosa DSM 723 TaxID=1121388 RepID=A0A8B6X5G5_9BURK|nr:twin transmembrane helix small protein [Derxia gummosa]
MKLLVALAFAVIVASLFSALFFLLKSRDSARTARALTLRIGLSIALFLFILLAWRLGWIEAHGVAFRRMGG